MNEASFASLSPTLLARKGGAKPAMRPQHARLMTGGQMNSDSPQNLDDLGWDDMGQEDGQRHEAEILQLTPSPANEDTAAEGRALDEKAEASLSGSATSTPEVVKQQREIAERLDTTKGQVAVTTSKAAPRARRSAIDRGKRAAFTLRLDAERHLKLRLACTVRNRSAQQIVTEALDALMSSLPEIESLASQVKRPKAATGPKSSDGK